MIKYLRVLSYSFFFVLLVLSILFFKERIFYYDSAFQFFKIIFFSDFNIEASRYSTFIIQVPTLLALKLGFSLKSLSIIFSATFIVVYSSIFLIVIRVFKNDFAGLAIVMSLAMGTSLGFFHTVTEIHQGIIYSLFFLGCLYLPVTRSFTGISILVVFIFAFIIGTVAFFSHPSVVFLLVFILGFYLIDQNVWRKISTYILIVLLIIGTLLKLINTEAGSYEGHLFSQPALFTSLAPKFWTLPGFKFFFNRIIGIYFFTVVTGIIVTINYIYLKKWLKLGYFLLAAGIFFLITLVTYHEGNAAIAMERVFLPLNVFVAIPFCKDFVFRKKQITLPVMVYISLLLLTSIGFILEGAQKYKKRTEYLESLIKSSRKYTETKFIVHRDQLNMDRVEVPWAFSTETLLLSSLEGNSSTTIYFTETIDDINTIDMQDPSVLLITSFWMYWNAEELNPDYFKLAPGPYRILKGNLKSE